jgi:hypothetical protein
MTATRVRLSWADFEEAAPEFASAGRRLLVGADGVAIAFLASVSRDARPHLSPVCPIFALRGLYQSAGSRTPKCTDLARGGAYALHAFLGAHDEEYQVAGRAREVTDESERTLVKQAIPFPAFGPDDPFFDFEIARCLWCWWEKVGQPDTRPVKRRWRCG